MVCNAKENCTSSSSSAEPIPTIQAIRRVPSSDVASTSNMDEEPARVITRPRRNSRASSPKFSYRRDVSRIIAASNRLPVAINANGDIKKSCGGLASAMEGAAKGQDLLWIGWPGRAVEAEDQPAISKKLMDSFKFVPIFMNQTEIDDFYTGYSNCSLWPLLHYMTTYAKFDDKWFESYKSVNQKFADAIIETAEPNDLVWIHDYHLLLVPSMVKEKRPELRVGFFLHTPFPSYEVIRCNPNAKELTQGLLGADLIGFHTFGYLRHFRSAVLRLNGAHSELGYIDLEGHRTRIGVYPIGINGVGFREVLSGEAFEQNLKHYTDEFKGKKVVLSVERLDYTKGVPQKLLAIERYLERYPKAAIDTKFIIIAVPSRQDVEEYQKLEELVHLEVSRINGQHSSLTEVPIHYIHRNVPMDKLAALYGRADVCLVTPLIDGMNLVAKEFIACKLPNRKDITPGMLVLSEFAGAAQELFNAMLVNPNDISGVAHAIEEALSTPESQMIAFTEQMRVKVLENDSTYWAKSILKELSKDSDQEFAGLPVSLTADVTTEFKPMKGKKALFLDYDGTLQDFVKTPSKAVPSARLHRILQALSDRSDMDVTIISGRDVSFLQQHLGKYRNFTLVAEHGFRIRRPNEDWKLLNPHIDLSWTDDVKPILNLFANMTPGAHVEEKVSSLVWHYRSTDPEFGSWKAAELINELGSSVHNLPVKVQHGKKIVEVASVQVNKGIAMAEVLGTSVYDAILCAGDDLTDEEMFSMAPEEAVTIKIGRGDSKARYRVPSCPAFLQTLEQIVGLSTEAAKVA